MSHPYGEEVPEAEELPPNLDGYIYLGRNVEDNLPVYQKVADSSLWIRAGETWVPFSITHDHTSGLGRVNP